MSEVTQTTRSSDAAEQRRSDAASQEAEQSRAVLRPAADIFEHSDGITVLMDMPGVSRERLTIESDRNSMVVEGEVLIDMPSGTESMYADVRSTRFRRSFSLSGEQLDTDAVKASLDNGVLRIDIPKRAEVRPRRIEVQSG